MLKFVVKQCNLNTVIAFSPGMSARVDELVEPLLDRLRSVRGMEWKKNTTSYFLKNYLIFFC